ncbi:MAG: hypothetical protein R6V04_00335, partial [bacterium]
RQGHEVKIISKYRPFNYEDFLKIYPIELTMWGKYILPDIPQFRRNPFKLLSRVLHRMLSWILMYPVILDMFKVKRKLRTEPPCDLLISFAVPYPVHWGVAWARKRKNPIATKWIADCGDPFMGNTLDTFKPPFYFKYFEKWFFRKADLITIPIDTAISGYYSEFHSKIRTIPQGFDFDLDNKASDYELNHVPTFAYAGGFLPGARDPKELMEFLVKINVSFKFLVFTKDPSMIESYKEFLRDRLVVSDFIPREELLKILSKMDFLINFDNNTTLNSPSKLIDYAIVGRPVFNITRTFDHSKFERFLKGDYRGRMDIPDLERYHIKNVTNNFFKLLSELK